MFQTFPMMAQNKPKTKIKSFQQFKVIIIYKLQAKSKKVQNFRFLITTLTGNKNVPIPLA